MLKMILKYNTNFFFFKCRSILLVSNCQKFVLDRSYVIFFVSICWKKKNNGAQAETETYVFLESEDLGPW